MTKLEKVVKGLECCAACSGDECKNCPYSLECRDTDLPYGMPHLAADALELLKNYQPKVMTLEETTNISIANNNAYHDKDATFVWIEEERGTLCICCSEYEPDLGYDDRGDSVRITYMGTDYMNWLYLRDYNKTWRCWTEKPTDEQRKAVEWNNENVD